MRHIVSTAVVAVVVSLATMTAVGALAQEPGSAVPSAVSSINADRVDGKHAVGAGAGIRMRARKLVATNKNGYLPANIVKGLVTNVTITTVQSPSGHASNAGQFTFNTATCPEGSVVVGGGYGLSGVPFVIFYQSRATDSRTWAVGGWNPSDGGGATVHAYAHCMSTTPGGSISAAARSEFGPAKPKVRKP